MPRPNDRPMLMGTRGAVVSGHYLATAAGHRIALEGGNAIDVAAATALCLAVIEQHETSPGGECPILVYAARDRKVHAISGVGPAPAALSIDWCRNNGYHLIPGENYVAACVPSFMGTWTLALQRFGTMTFAQVAQPALELAERGFPMYPAQRRTLTTHRDRLLAMHPTTCDVYLPGGRVPEVGERITNPALADVLRVMCAAESGHANEGRIKALEAARDAFYKGPVVDRILDFISANPMPDYTGAKRTGLLDHADFADWHATVEEPLVIDYSGLLVHKCPAWTQGPVFLQQLRLLEGFDLAAMRHNSAEYVHTVVECAKLAFADRDAYYGDPAFVDVPFDQLLSSEYSAARRALVAEQASVELRPGDAGRGAPDFVTFDPEADNRRALGLTGAPPHGRASDHGDTSHLDVLDAEGNMVAATPSGGWLVHSPVVPGVGFPLGTRAQAFDLNPRRPNSLEPRKRPRSTLTPSLVTRDGRPLLAFGMRGGDVQDQRTLHFFLAHVHFGMDIQSALDIPTFYSEHFPSSFYPRKGFPARLTIERRIGADVLDELRRRGHDLNVTDDQRHNTMCVELDARGLMSAGVCSNGEQAYALAW